MNEIPIHAVGRLIAMPERTYRQDGVAVTRLQVEVRERRLTPNGWRTTSAVTLECRAWAGLAEHVWASLNTGDRIVITGRLRQRPLRPGTTAYDVMLQDVGVSLAFANVNIVREDAGTGAGVEMHPESADDSHARTVAVR